MVGRGRHAAGGGIREGFLEGSSEYESGEGGRASVQRHGGVREQAGSGLRGSGLVDPEVPGGSWDCGGAKPRGSGLRGVGDREPQKVK